MSLRLDATIEEQTLNNLVDEILMPAEMPKYDTVGPTAVCPLQPRASPEAKSELDGRTVTVELP